MKGYEKLIRGGKLAKLLGETRKCPDDLGLPSFRDTPKCTESSCDECWKTALESEIEILIPDLFTGHTRDDREVKVWRVDEDLYIYTELTESGQSVAISVICTKQHIINNLNGSLFIDQPYCLEKVPNEPIL